MAGRFKEMRTLLERSRYFKLVCGAGNENADEVRKLSFVYTLGGANGLDVSATPEIVEACMQGIDEAYARSGQFGIDIDTRPFITVSVGMPGDHHVRKAIINENCVSCDRCIPVCPTTAITDDLVVIREQCIGCGNCEAACPPRVAAISYEHNAKTLAKILPDCLAAGAENIELHAAVLDDGSIMEEWKVVVASQPDNFVSLCLDRLHLSNTHLIERIKEAKKIAGDKLIIQADGVPMGGGSDDFGTTLQAVAIAEIIQKDLKEKHKQEFRRLPILLSGGTNSFTGKLAKQCNVSFSGVSIGTHARKIVQDLIDAPGFEEDSEKMRLAVSRARELVDMSISP